MAEIRPFAGIRPEKGKAADIAALPYDVYSRKEAADFFLRAIAGSEGSECERYTKIYTELLMGKSVCTDGE